MALIQGANSKENLVGVHSAGIDDSQVMPVTAAALNGQPRWRLVTDSGFAGEIGLSGEVFGTNGFEDITVFDLPGTILFDASFNRGGDVIRLHGDAGGWNVILTGSNAVLNDGDAFVVVPIGAAGIAMVFDDGMRTLRYDAAADKARIGTQEITGEEAAIAAAASAGAVPDDADPSAVAQLLMANNGAAIAGGNLLVFGTAGEEQVQILHGQVELDPSFNRGNDLIRVNAWTGDFTAALVGSNVLLDGALIDLIVPVGTAGTSVYFRNGERIFGYNDERDAVLVFLPQIGIAIPLNDFV